MTNKKEATNNSIETASNKKSQKALTVEDEPKLLEQFYITLESNIVQVTIHNPEAEQEILAQVKELLVAPKSWKNAYKIEQLMVEVYGEIALQMEIDRRLLEVSDTLYPNQAKFYQEKANQLENEKQKRSFLGRLLNDLQWQYMVREGKQLYLRITRKRTSLLLIFSILLFLFALLLMMHYGTAETLKKIVVIALTITAGFMGAAFSMVTGLKDLEQKSFNDLKIVHRTSYLISRAIIGVGASLILYYFVTSGIISGDLFPQSNSNGDVDFYKLIVWGFIAGFSEKLIPSLISKTEERINNSVDSGGK